MAIGHYDQIDDAVDAGHLSSTVLTGILRMNLRVAETDYCRRCFTSRPLDPSANAASLGGL